MSSEHFTPLIMHSHTAIPPRLRPTPNKHHSIQFKIRSKYIKMIKILHLNLTHMCSLPRSLKILHSPYNPFLDQISVIGYLQNEENGMLYAMMISFIVSSALTDLEKGIDYRYEPGLWKCVCIVVSFMYHMHHISLRYEL